MFVRKMLNRPNHRIGCVHNATKTARNLYCNTIMLLTTAIMFMTAQHAEKKFGWTLLLAQAALNPRNK